MSEDLEFNAAGIGYLFADTDIVCFGTATHPVIAVDRHGQPWPWLVDLSHIHHADMDCCRAVAPEHERLGRLPDRLLARIQHGGGDRRG